MYYRVPLGEGQASNGFRPVLKYSLHKWPGATNPRIKFKTGPAVDNLDVFSL